MVAVFLCLKSNFFLSSKQGENIYTHLKVVWLFSRFSAYYFLNSKQGHFAPTGGSSKSRPLVSVAGASPPKTPIGFSYFHGGKSDYENSD